MLLSTLKKTAGILLLIIGLAALVTPLTPGSWLMFIGLELLGLRLLVNNGLRTCWARAKAWLRTPVFGLLRYRRPPSPDAELSREKGIPPQ